MFRLLDANLQFLYHLKTVHLLDIYHFCSNALPFNLVHFPTGEYPGKLTWTEILSEDEISEHLDCLSK